MLDENQRRIKQVLEYDVPVDQVRKYESAISYLDSITEDAIKAETQDSEQLRGNILVQDYMNKGSLKKELTGKPRNLLMQVLILKML